MDLGLDNPSILDAANIDARGHQTSHSPVVDLATRETLKADETVEYYMNQSLTTIPCLTCFKPSRASGPADCAVTCLADIGTACGEYDPCAVLGALPASLFFDKHMTCPPKRDPKKSVRDIGHSTPLTRPTKDAIRDRGMIRVSDQGPGVKRYGETSGPLNMQK